MPIKNNDPRWNGGINGQSTRNRHGSYNSTGATHGIRGTSRQGQGQQGLDNQAPGEVTDTTKMTPEQKLEYFKSLGLVKNITK